jgi:hypothetical protein
MDLTTVVYDKRDIVHKVPSSQQVNVKGKREV